MFLCSFARVSDAIKVSQVIHKYNIYLISMIFTFIIYTLCNIKIIITNSQEVLIMFEEYDDLLTVSELSEALKIGNPQCYHLLSAGTIKAYKYGRVWKIPKANLISHIHSMSQEVL